uniref:uncharacterized protein LOC122583610 n=1 Tax=Erigeron canadensis TaxID=72917 RepID=UPI001CB97A58|nr:uncharacterized protein LOC122583610 [Erigeron canadensis]
MERTKRRKLKFPCLFGGIDERSRREPVQSWSPDNATAKQRMFKFEVGKSPSKQRKGKPTQKLSARGVSNETSAEKCSPSILAKLMGRGAQQRRLSNNFSTMNMKAVKEDLVALHVANQLHSSLSIAKVSDLEFSRNVVLKPNTTNTKTVKNSFKFFNENIECSSNVAGCKYGNARETINDIDRRMNEGCESEDISLSDCGYIGDDSLHVFTSGSFSETEVIATTSRITIDRNDRLTHSLSKIFERSLVIEAKNRISERWKTTGRHEHVESVNKGSTLREILSFPNEEMRPEESSNVAGLVEVNDISSVPSVPSMALGNCGGNGQRDRCLISMSESISLVPSSPDPNDMVNVNDEIDADEKVVVYSEPLKRSKRGDISLQKVGYNKKSHSSQPGKIFSTEFGVCLPESQTSKESTKISFGNEGPTKYQPAISNVDDYNDATYAAFLFGEVSGFKIETSLESLNKLNANLVSRVVGDINSSRVDETSQNYQLSGPQSESRESFKDVVHSHQCSLLKALPSEDVSSDSDSYERLYSRLQELRKQRHMMKVQSALTSNNLKLTPTVKKLRQGSSGATQESVNSGSSFTAQILQASGINSIDPDTFTPAYQSVHLPIDPRLFYRLKKYYFEGVVLSRSEKCLVHDYFEQTFIRTSKSMVAQPWVNPAKRKGQLTLKKFKIEDQIRKLINEIDREDDEIFFAVNCDKDPEWDHPTNEMDILGKLIGELVLNDLVLEFIKF